MSYFSSAVSPTVDVDPPPSSSSEAAAKRWVCDVCTFENVRASVKCSMCRTSRAIRSSAPSPSSDIFKLGSGMSPPSGGGGASTSSRSSSPFHSDNNNHQQAKWACLMCTYLNWPRAVRCAQCLYPKRRVSPAVSRNSPISPRSHLHHLNQQHANQGGGTGDQQTNNRPQSTSPPPAPSSSSVTPETLATVMESQLELESAKNRNNSSPPPPTSHEQQQQHQYANSSCASTSGGKWNCVACTYENWPKSKCCVICGVLRGSYEVVNTATTGIQQSNPSTQTTTQQQQTQSRNRNNDYDVENNCDYERRLRQFRRRLRETDWSWLSACMGVAEGDLNPVEAYLNGGGDAARKLTNPETSLLNCNRPLAVYEAGHTLVHLAIKFHREDMLATLLSQFDTSSHVTGSHPTGIKCVPSYVAPDLASAIRRHISQAVRQRKGSFPCYYLCEWATYSMPSEIEDLPPATQEQLYNELMDKDAQKELEDDCVEAGAAAINWSEEIRISLGSRLHALWNRSAGDCLLDSVLQATWGVFDRDNALRTAMADSLHEAGQMFYPRWKDWELRQAMDLHYTIDDAQLSEDWSEILSLASKPGASLEQVHVFCLAHVLRRPIIVYGVKYVKSWRGENLGFARFEGVYLPLLWEPSFCSRSPIALGYTRGHFCALVPPEPVLLASNTCSSASSSSVYQRFGGGATSGLTSGDCTEAAATGPPPAPTSSGDSFGDTFLPLVTSDRKQFLPIPYLRQNEIGNTEAILRQWLDVRVTDSGLVVAVQKIAKPPLLVAQMTEEWLNHYRKLAQSSTAVFSSRSANGMNNICRVVRRRSSPLSARRSPPHGGAAAAMVVGGAADPRNGPAATTAPAVPTTVASGPQPTTVVPSAVSAVVTTPNLQSVAVVNTSCYSSDGDSDEE